MKGDGTSSSPLHRSPANCSTSARGRTGLSASSVSEGGLPARSQLSSACPPQPWRRRTSRLFVKPPHIVVTRSPITTKPISGSFRRKQGVYPPHPPAKGRVNPRGKPPPSLASQPQTHQLYYVKEQPPVLYPTCPVPSSTKSLIDIAARHACVSVVAAAPPPRRATGRLLPAARLKHRSRCSGGSTSHPIPSASPHGRHCSHGAPPPCRLCFLAYARSCESDHPKPPNTSSLSDRGTFPFPRARISGNIFLFGV